MRILVVTNLYPPHHVGGYELGCRDVVEALRARGHTVQVLTSNFRLSDGAATESEPEVERSLHLVIGHAAGRHRKLRECRLLVRALQSHRPDIVYFWNQGGLTHWLPMVAKWLGYRCAFFLSDTNFVSWRIGAFLTRRTEAGTAIARLLHAVFGGTFLVRGWPVIQNQPCQFASLFLLRYAERAGIHLSEGATHVVHWGIEVQKFETHRSSRWPFTRLLYVGQLIPQKGVHTAIAALAILSEEPKFQALTLRVVGGGMHPKYEKTLREQTERAGLAGRVNFLGKIPRSELPQVYADHDILVFPSEWDEPFAITPLEAMVSGLVVVGTTTGGSGELLRDRETAMTFEAGNAADCARAIRDLCDDQQLHETIRRNGELEIKKSHTLDVMVTGIEAELQAIAPRAPA
jgi:glycogen synthase